MTNNELVDYIVNNMDIHSNDIGDLRRYQYFLKEVKRRYFTNDQKEVILNKLEEHTNILKSDLYGLNKILSDTNNKRYREVLLYRDFPYRNKFDLNKDIDLYNTVSPSISNYKGEECVSKLGDDTTRLINFLLDSTSSTTLSKEYKYFEGSSLSFYLNPKFFRKNSKYLDDDGLVDMFNMRISNGQFDSEAIGRYGELKVVNKFKSSNDNVIWVARNLGDGFGYDVGIYDKENDKYSMYEVKTTKYINNLGKFTLSSKEEENMLKKYNNCNSYIYNIYLNSKGEISKEKLIGQEEYKKEYIKK